MVNAPRCNARHRATALALAVATLAVAGGSAPARAQFYSVGGTVSSGPVDLIPTLDPNLATFDLLGNQLYVGGLDTAGSFAALAGAQLLNAGQLVAGFGGAGTGAISLSGPGTLVQVGGTGGRLDIGSWGTGSLSVSAGAVLNAANVGNCTPASFCGNFIGNAAGSTATLSVSGSGSALHALGFFGVGNASVYTQANGGFDFGTPGGFTTATVNVSAGGLLRTQNTVIGQGAGGPGLIGGEGSFANVLIEGSGSRWVVGRNALDNTAALMSIGGSASGSGAVTVRSGGQLFIDATGSAGPFDGLNVGGNGTGSLVVTGQGSSVVTTGINRFLNVGANNSNGRGTMRVLAGATASSMYANVGRNGAQGLLEVDGAGSQLDLTGVGVAIASAGANGSPAWLWVGRNGSSGEVAVRNGGRIVISDGGQDARANGLFSPGLGLGSQANGHGTLTISGAGSVVEVVSTSMVPDAGTGDNANPYVGIGYDNAATSSGTLRVEAGGKLLLTGNAVSTPTHARVTTLAIGGTLGRAGQGLATVTGAGSEIRLTGDDAYISVGRATGGNGTLNLLDGGLVGTTSMTVGAVGTGLVTIDNATLALSGRRHDGTNVGAAIVVGRGTGGKGTLAMDHGARVTVTPEVLSGGFVVGGDSFESGGSGTLTMAGGSSVKLLGNVVGNAFIVGYTGTGTATLTGASSVDAGNTGTAMIGRLVGGNGTLDLSGASWLRANEVAIGGTSDSSAGGTGLVTVSGAGSLLKAEGASGFISVGRSSTGALSVSSAGEASGIVMNVGRGAGGNGTLSVNGGVITLSGRQSSGSQVGAALTIGSRGGSGTANIANQSLVTITNLDPAGASLNLGGTPINPLGNGILNVSGGSQVRVVAASGLAQARIGHDGSGTASFSGASLLDVGDGDVIIAGQPGSFGTLVLSSGSTLNAGYVGVGSLPGGIDGGTAALIVNASTVNATTLEVGRGGLVGGHLGVINANVINRGVFNPGNSPGKIIINGGFSTVEGTIVLDVEAVGADQGSFQVDQLVLTQASTFDFHDARVVFNFIGNTDPNAFATAGGLDLDNFIRVQDPQGQESGLSTQLASQGSSWEQAFAGGTFSATSEAYDVSALNLKTDQSGTFQFTATPVPEPQTWLLWLGGGAALAAWRRRRVRG